METLYSFASLAMQLLAMALVYLWRRPNFAAEEGYTPSLALEWLLMMGAAVTAAGLLHLVYTKLLGGEDD